ncbi:MAG: FtsQ-type POTRA domain-containing protein [Sphaerochaetaceae bacterium]|nr:FtsQ-type POTRA domain-containing protein [Sphaerochaetaceae bacterium]
MKNKHLAGLLLVLLFTVIVIVALYFAARNVPYFNINTVNLKITGQSEEANSRIKHIVSGIKGRNILEISTTSIKDTIRSMGGVKSVSVTRYFPSTVNIEVVYQNYICRAYSDNGETENFYLAGSSSMEKTDSETYRLYSNLAEVELFPAYALLIEKWGYDQGFIQMMNLAGSLGSETLITAIKYDNNNSDSFGLLKLEMSSINSVLYVREPVTPQRLNEALRIIADDGNISGGERRYDLYSTALVKRK